MDCTTQTQQWFYLCLALCGVIVSMLAMFFNYTLKLKDRQIVLEKKNGQEQKQIDELKKALAKLKARE